MVLAHLVLERVRLVIQAADRGNLAGGKHKPVGDDRLGEGPDGGRAAGDLRDPADGPVYGGTAGRTVCGTLTWQPPLRRKIE